MSVLASVFSKRLSFELGVGATISEATREAGAPMIFLEHGAISGGVRDAAAGAGTWKIAGAAQWRFAASCETRQVYFRAEFGFHEGTPLYP